MDLLLRPRTATSSRRTPADDEVTAILEDRRKSEGDLLVGADAIWSKLRKLLFGQTQKHLIQNTLATSELQTLCLLILAQLDVCASKNAVLHISEGICWCY